MASAHRRTWEVHLDAVELQPPTRVGWLHQNLARTDTPAAFEYDRAWLRGSDPFSLDPRLELYRGEQHPAADTPAFGIFMDSAPDRWGRVLMERREAAAAEREGRPLRALREVDFLLGVHDEARMGALRFRADEASPFVENLQSAAPPVTSLRELAHISRRVEEPGVETLPEYERWLAMLVAPGSSLGGARPKANFRELDQSLWLAKFPAKDDRYDLGAWEFVTQQLALRAGVVMPEARLEALGGDFRSYCAQRFDRIRHGGAESRRMYASAMTLLERRDGDAGASYLDLAEFIMDRGARGHVAEDLAQLFRRLVFNVLVGNRDDHLRNHGFIRTATGWRLAPAFDVNPNPAKAEHALTLDGQSAAPELARVVATAELYRLRAGEAAGIVGKVRSALAGWREAAERHGLGRPEVQRMESVIQA
ncbi:HipA domain protein [Rubrivivax gelatinosus]|nr:HipA domain protein [Rubrivivax gelatinosus]